MIVLGALLVPRDLEIYGRQVKEIDTLVQRDGDS